MPTPTDDRRDLLTVIAYMRAAPGKRDELRQALESLIEPTSQEKGYVNYDLHQSLEDPDLFFFYENWESARTWTPTSRHPTSGTSPRGSPTCSTTAGCRSTGCAGSPEAARRAGRYPAVVVTAATTAG